MEGTRLQKGLSLQLPCGSADRSARAEVPAPQVQRGLWMLRPDLRSPASPNSRSLLRAGLQRCLSTYIYIYICMYIYIYCRYTSGF